ncbi:putative component of NuA3 histone acetyltransferase complex, partial [Elasticomyces elasticus]
MAVKRKASAPLTSSSPPKKLNFTKPSTNTSFELIATSFRSNLFESGTVNEYTSSYATSTPYPHAVVPSLIQDSLLRNVRKEIQSNIHFTLKETDIYRIHQSGDLANLTNLDKDSLAKLPSLVQLRDALYSPQFRKWVSSVTGAGALSGSKTDMAVNIYTPGSYLLCHDDVIGSRRVSYILYLTDPDEPWQPSWGGGLRLYDTELRKTSKNGEEVRVPYAEVSKVIPPSAGQLSFFTVLPGESYHDVEEVYHVKPSDSVREEKRIRMAVSGWFHIPQDGEDGFEAGREQAMAQRSSLKQLEGAADEFDEPRVVFRHFDEGRRVENAQLTGEELDPGEEGDNDGDILTEQDLTFLIPYISAGFLVPDKLEELVESFEETSMLQLQGFLSEKFANRIKAETEAPKAQSDTAWKVARPPHKHRYAYLNDEHATDTASPFTDLLKDLLHSHAFKKWLALATGLNPAALTKQYALARRFRKGQDYALANTYTSEQPRLEFTINLTPSTGWEGNAEMEPEVHVVDGVSKTNGTNGHVDGKGKAKSTNGINGTDRHANSDTTSTNLHLDTSLADAAELGGEEIYMAADDDDTHSHVDLPSVGRASKSAAKKQKLDPAVYKAGDEADDDGGILFSSAPSWNTFEVVLRDKGTMRFVKY